MFLNTPSCSVLAWRSSCKVPAVLSEFNKNWHVGGNFTENPKYWISAKSHRPSYMQSGGYGETDIHCSCMRLWCSTNCYWQLFALAYYEVSDVVLIFRLHIFQAHFTDIVAYPSAMTAISVSRRDCQRATLMAWHTRGDLNCQTFTHLYCTCALIGFIYYLKTHLFLNKYNTGSNWIVTVSVVLGLSDAFKRRWEARILMRTSRCRQALWQNCEKRLIALWRLSVSLLL
jgi:hypothetical protein